MEGFWPIFYLMVILKIPVAAMLYLVWWAVRQTEEPEQAPPGDEREPLRWHPRPKRPRGPRRGGPHTPDAQPIPACPPGGRLRIAVPPAPVRASRDHGRGLGEPIGHE